VRLLALTAARLARAFESVVIGRVRGGGSDFADVTVARIASLGSDPAARREKALAHLDTILDLYDRGMREPLPLSCDASAAYAQAALAGGNPESAARSAWASGFGYDKEDRQPEHLIVYGAALDFAELLEQAIRSDEQGPGWHDSEPTRFGRYARRLWDELLASETVSDQ
jgi:exodeoxyribonuclease V gamma subunit